VKKRYHKILRRDSGRIARRLRRKNFTEQPEPMIKDLNIEYEVSERTRAAGYGGIGAIHTMVCKLGLDQEINKVVKLLKAHNPYYESDHVLNMAYNVITGGTCLEDIERLRQNESYLNGLGAERIPDPTTAGDFLRRFEDEGAILSLQEAINETRKKVWVEHGKREKGFLAEGIIDADGTIAETTGECKGGMDISYKGTWGYAPLIISLGNTNEELYLVNRSGNQTSADGAAEWIDRAIELVGGVFKKVWIRGDSDFSLTKNFDRWSEQGVGFVFGYDAKANLVEMADELPKSRWKRLNRPAKYEVETEARKPRDNVKDAMVKKREFKNIRLESEDVAEFSYRPTACKQEYRMVVVRKNLSVEKGAAVLFDDIRYFFYITNDQEKSKSKQEIVFFANGRCNQENLIGQMKSGVNALGMPSSNLHSNWAYMVIAGLAWNLKAWYGLLVRDTSKGDEIVRMEFKRFLLSFIQIPCQILKTGRRVVYRILCYSEHLKTFLATFEYLKRLKLT
jgi:DDE family transposase